MTRAAREEGRRSVADESETQRGETDAPATSVDEKPSAEGCSGRVLVVDDAEANRELLTAILQALGLTVATAYDPVRARNPGRANLQCTAAVRAGGGVNAAVPVFAITANVGREQLDACFEVGTDGHLSTPISTPSSSPP